MTDQHQQENNDTQAAINAGVIIGSIAAEPIDRGKLYLTRNPITGEVEVLDTNTDLYLDDPKRKEGSIVLRDAESFLAYWRKHHLPQSEVFSDVEAATVTAIFDAHNASSPDGEFPGTAGWGKHRATLSVRKTAQWLAWEGMDRKWMTQRTFAEHIEDHLDDIAAPPAAEMLELAMSFQAKKDVEFKSSNILSSSQRELVYQEDVSATAGRTGSITIPATFDLGLEPFEGTEAYKVTARFRYRIEDGALSLAYFLIDPDKVLREVFGDILTEIQAGIGDTPIVRGTPAR